MSVCWAGRGRGCVGGMRVTQIFCLRSDDFFNPQITSLIVVSRRTETGGPPESNDNQTDERSHTLSFPWQLKGAFCESAIVNALVPKALANIQPTSYNEQLLLWTVSFTSAA